ncbi:glycosyltransferase [Salana multivorans]
MTERTALNESAGRPRRVLVTPHHSEIGGSQIIALELADAVDRLPGFEVLLYMPEGALMERARASGLPVFPTKLRESAPSVRRIIELARLVRSSGVDLVHTYEWAPTVDAAFAAATTSVPRVATVYSMDYPYFVPKDVPTVFGTREMVQVAQGEGRSTYLIEPPIDTERFRPGACRDATLQEVRSECGAGDGDVLAIVVSRLAADLKLEGLLELIAAAGRVALERPLRLAIVGDGPERGALELSAENVNSVTGRRVVSLLGSRDDPIPYYLAADVAVGMGSSALRAMAAGKPLLVQGAASFWEIADDETIPQFRAQGWYGVGDGRSSERCTELLRRLVDLSPKDRERLGRLGRSLVEDEYSLTRAATTLTSVYTSVLQHPRTGTGARAGRAVQLAAEIAKYRTALRWPALQRASRALSGR